MGVVLDKIKAFPARFRGIKGRNLEDAAKYLQSAWQAELGTVGTKEHPAPPGSLPHKISGGLQRGVKVVANAWLMRLEMHYGSLVARWQDQGTKKMKARPHREVTFKKHKAQVWAILGRK